jgi:Asp-tRNA(Asn)/Glu-tRNA(Gln) amidotransferase A subunit family amidase
MMGQLPVAGVPTGIADYGVPTDIQLVCRTYDDPRIFQAAAAYEKAQSWFHKTNARPPL